MIPVDAHLDMLSSQYLASAMRADHPAHSSVTRPAQRRRMKETLQSRHTEEISASLVNGSLPAGAYPETKNALHTSYVSKAISAQGNHPLLATRTPDINKSEADLPRHHRSTISQLRSGHCLKLRS